MTEQATNLTNWLDFEMDCVEADRAMPLFLLTRDDGRATYADPALDVAVSNGAYAAAHPVSLNKEDMLVAYPAGTAAQTVLEQMRGAGQDVSVKPFKWEGLSKTDQVSLLIASLPSRDDDFFMAAKCVTGKLLFKIEPKKDGEKPEEESKDLTENGFPCEISALEAGAENCCDRTALTLRVRSYTNIEAITDENTYFRPEKPMSSYPRYTSDLEFVSRVLPSDEKGKEHRLYIPRKRNRARKNTYDFMGVGYADGFQKSKMRIAAGVIASLSSKEKNPFIELSLHELPVVHERPIGKSKWEDAPWRENLKRVQLTVDTEDETLQRRVESLVKVLDAYGIEARVVTEAVEGVPEIRVVSSRRALGRAKKDGKEWADRHSGETEQLALGRAVQHMTDKAIPQRVAKRAVDIEDGKRTDKDNPFSRMAGAESALKELWIKQQCLDMRIEGWDPSGIRAFGAPHYRTERRQRTLAGMSFIEVKDDGFFSYSHIDSFDALLGDGELCDAMNATRGKTDTEAVVVFKNGAVATIAKTGAFTMPDGLLDIAKGFDEGAFSPGVKSKEHEGLIKSLLNVKVYAEGGRTFYAVGEERKSLNKSIAKSSQIREIRAAKGEIGPDEVLAIIDLLEDDFVRLRRPTVVPYPFKFLRERAAMEGHPLAPQEDDQGNGPDAEERAEAAE